MKIDNRWSAGASNPPVDIPEFRAAYGARWIDQGDWTPPDVVYDRQGFAYDDPKARDELIAKMLAPFLGGMAMDAERGDVAVHLANEAEHGYECWVRRVGGYFYVDAWLR